MITFKRLLFAPGVALSALLLLQVVTPYHALAASSTHRAQKTVVLHRSMPTVSQKPGSVHSCPPTIQAGSTGSWVVTLQNNLNNFGYGPIQVDGIFGPRTGSAVGQFQRDAGLVDDGIVGPQTWGALGYC